MPLSEAAAALGRSPSFVRRLVARRAVPYFKVGGRLLFDVRDLSEYLESCRVESPRVSP